MNKKYSIFSYGSFDQITLCFCEKKKLNKNTLWETIVRLVTFSLAYSYLLKGSCTIRFRNKFLSNQDWTWTNIFQNAFVKFHQNKYGTFKRSRHKNAEKQFFSDLVSYISFQNSRQNTKLTQSRDHSCWVTRHKRKKIKTQLNQNTKSSWSRLCCFRIEISERWFFCIFKKCFHYQSDIARRSNSVDRLHC